MNKDVALVYLKYGWPIIPTSNDRIPFVRYKIYQMGEMPSILDVETWWAKNPYAEIALVTTRDHMVIDIDTKQAYDLFEPYFKWCPVVKTNGKEYGYHIHFRTKRFYRSIDYKEGFTVKSSGAIAHLPPTKHHSTRKLYEWVSSPSLFFNKTSLLPQCVENILTPTKPYGSGAKKIRGNLFLDVFEHYGINLASVGDVYCGKCPFEHRHENGTDSIPSFRVFADGGWKCFGCGMYGKDAYDFVMEKEGCGFNGAKGIVDSITENKHFLHFVASTMERGKAPWKN